MRIHIMICIVMVTILTACATDEKTRDIGPQGSVLERIPIVYRQNIQQGNVITQEMVNQLRVGLSKRQVRFIMGTPILVDVFHQSRWDYTYAMTHGWGDTKTKMIQIYFDDQDKLEYVTGDLKPIAGSNEQPIKQEVLVSVPDYQDPNRGVLKQAVESIRDIFSGGK